MATQAQTTIQVENLPSMDEIMSEDVQALLNGALDVLRQVAVRHEIYDGMVDIDLYTFHDDGDQKIFLTHEVERDTATAGEYWNDLAVTMYDWVQSLPPDVKGEWGDRIAVAVVWSE